MTAQSLFSTPQQALAALLELHNPRRILLVSNSHMPVLSAYCDAHPDVRLSQAGAGALPSKISAQRYDLAVLADCLEHLPQNAGLELLAGIRNLNTNRMAVLVDMNACHWDESDFFALAMQTSQRFQREQQTLTLLTYDLHDYRQVPDWLNAKFWANPQHFGKYWW